MDTNPPEASTVDLETRLALARKAFEDFYPICFWNWRKDTTIDQAVLPSVAAQLRLYGGRKGFLLAAQLCPSPQSRKKFFDFSVSTATRRAT